MTLDEAFYAFVQVPIDATYHVSGRVRHTGELMVLEGRAVAYAARPPG